MTTASSPHPDTVSNPRHYRYFDLVMAGFVTSCSART